MATITTTIAADIFGLAFANVQSCFTFSIVPPILFRPSCRRIHSLLNWEFQGLQHSPLSPLSCFHPFYY